MFVNRNRAGARWLVILTAVSLMPGCGAFGLRKQLQQLEHENSRLLSEFRAERQRREAAEQSAQQLEHRLAESPGIRLMLDFLGDSAPAAVVVHQAQYGAAPVCRTHSADRPFLTGNRGRALAS